MLSHALPRPESNIETDLYGPLTSMDLDPGVCVIGIYIKILTCYGQL